MADQYQYIKLPDGSYGKFAANATDEQIRGAISRDFPQAYGPAALGGAKPQDVTALGPPGMSTPQDIQNSQMKAVGEGALMSTMQPTAPGDIMMMTRGAAPVVRGAGSLAEQMGKGLSWLESHSVPRFLTPSKGWGGGLEEAGKLMQRYTPDIRTPLPLREQLGPQRAPVIPQPKPNFGKVASREASTPRPALVQQMGGRPVEEITDQALKQKMEQSSELTYGLNAKRHAGPSKSYPEPAEWQDQAPENAPWGGQFYRR